MIYPPDLLDSLQENPSGPFAGPVYRHMFADYPPTAVNTRGARWNPPEVGAIYTSVEKNGAIAEAEYRLSVEPLRPTTRRTLYTLDIQLDNVLNMTSKSALAAVGVTDVELTSIDLEPCQAVGGATAWLDHDGLLIPSARHDSANLVIFPAAQDPDSLLAIVDEEVLEDPTIDS